MKLFFSLTSAIALTLATASTGGQHTNCTLVNLSESPRTNVFDATGTTISTTTTDPTSYNPEDAGREGWSISCHTVGNVDYVKYFLVDGDIKTHYSVPFWINGDNGGSAVNKFEYLGECGEKEIYVEFYIWSLGDDEPVDATTLKLDAGACELVSPTPSPVSQPGVAECTLVNLKESPRTNVFDATGITISATDPTPYNPEDAGREGWSINCATVGNVDYAKYFLEDSDVKTHYSVPFWINGDNGGSAVNKYEYLQDCGEKEISVEFYTWRGGDDAPVDTTTLLLDAGPCDTDPPVPAPTNLPVMVTAAPSTAAPTTLLPVATPVPSTAAPTCPDFQCPDFSYPIFGLACIANFNDCQCIACYEKINGACVKTCQPAPLVAGLSDPDFQTKFTENIPNPLDPSFLFLNNGQTIEVSAGAGIAQTGLVGGPDGQTPLDTPIYGFGTDALGYTWPGRTFVTKSNQPFHVRWTNKIPIQNGYLLTGIGPFAGRSAVDTSLHWAYSLHGYDTFSIEQDGTPIVPHLHGGNTESPSDGNPEFFFSPGFAVKGPQWVKEVYNYENNQAATALWYHDHTLGITRLNVHCGLAGFYFIRDDLDTGLEDNPLNLPAFPYELPILIQDRMFKENGELFYPAFPGDPEYDGFITQEGVVLPEATFPGGGPTALAEFFGDFMVVNGKIWPKAEVEPRQYRLRYLNGCDSRYLAMEFLAVQPGQDDLVNSVQVEFVVIGGSGGLSENPATKTNVILAPGDRLDVVIDFSAYEGKRIIQANFGGDSPFGGDIPGEQLFTQTDKIMAFDVVAQLDTNVADDFDPALMVSSLVAAGDTLAEELLAAPTDNTRRLALFEGRDEYGRLQPLLGTADPATDKDQNPILWPDTPAFQAAGLAGTQMSGSMTWDSPITENINVGAVEEWEIFNLSADAHPIHIHLVEIVTVARRAIQFDSNADVDGIINPGVTPAGDGTYLSPQPLVQHNGSIGQGFDVNNPTVNPAILPSPPQYTDDFLTDTVVVLPGTAVTIKARFDRPGRFVWHCHILAHEDHEMMRVLQVGEIPAAAPGRRGLRATEK